MVKYRTVRLPEELVNSVEKIIKKRANLGYRSNSEFIIDATRRRIEVLKDKTKKNQK